MDGIYSGTLANCKDAWTLISVHNTSWFGFPFSEMNSFLSIMKGLIESIEFCFIRLHRSEWIMTWCCGCRCFGFLDLCKRYGWFWPGLWRGRFSDARRILLCKIWQLHAVEIDVVLRHYHSPWIKMGKWYHWTKEGSWKRKSTGSMSRKADNPHDTQSRWTVKFYWNEIVVSPISPYFSPLLLS